MPMYNPTLLMTCGPTAGCGLTTPMVPTRVHTDSGVENGWQAPAACMHCGKAFGMLVFFDTPSPTAASRSAFSGIPRTENEPPSACECLDATHSEFCHSGPAHRGWCDMYAMATDPARASVISSASPLSEDEKRFLVESRKLVDSMPKNEFTAMRRDSLSAMLDIIARLSASAPSPEYNEDTRRLDAIERGLFRISPDGMDGWRVRAAGTLGGMRQGYVNYGAHRLREAIDAATEGRDPGGEA